MRSDNKKTPSLTKVSDGAGTEKRPELRPWGEAL